MEPFQEKYSRSPEDHAMLIARFEAGLQAQELVVKWCKKGNPPDGERLAQWLREGLQQYPPEVMDKVVTHALEWAAHSQTSVNGQGCSVESSTDSKAPSVATRLVELGRDSVAELWHDTDGEPYATLEVGNHLEHYPLKARAFREWLERLHYNVLKAVLN
jgi:hypothetical protein